MPDLFSNHHTNHTFTHMATVDDKKVIFSMVGVSKTIQQNQKQVLKNIYLSFFYGAKIGIIGLNGAGKSTLMKIIAGLDQQYQGEVVWSPGYTVGYLPQDPPLNETKTVKENVMEGVQHVYDALAEYDQINEKFGLPEYYEDPDKMEKLMNRQAELQDIIDATDAWNMDSKLERAMDALRCPPEDWNVDKLSGGERRRVALCRLLLQKPDVLLLDEPTNHLDISSREALEAALEDYEGTMLIITHDRYLVNRMADRILYMEEDGLTEYIGGYDDYLEAIARRPQPSAEAASPKAEKPNSYKAQKERQSILNRAAGAVRRAEERIAAAEQELEDINQKLASPVIASDYVKSAELAKKADDKQAEIDALYSQWEQAQQALDELCEENSKQG